MSRPWPTPSRLVADWSGRHRHPANLALHLIGIPASVVGAGLIAVGLLRPTAPPMLLATALFLGGYLAQFLGHAIEGSEPGELRAFRRRATHRVTMKARGIWPLQHGHRAAMRAADRDAP